MVKRSSRGRKGSKLLKRIHKRKSKSKNYRRKCKSKRYTTCRKRTRNNRTTRMKGGMYKGDDYLLFTGSRPGRPGGEQVEALGPGLFSGSSDAGPRKRKTSPRAPESSSMNPLPKMSSKKQTPAQVAEQALETDEMNRRARATEAAAVPPPSIAGAAPPEPEPEIDLSTALVKILNNKGDYLIVQQVSRKVPNPYPRKIINKANFEYIVGYNTTRKSRTVFLSEGNKINVAKFVLEDIS